MLQSVSQRSDAYCHLCNTGSTTVHCQLTVSVQLTAGNVRHTIERCSDVRWLRLHSVFPTSPVITVQFEAPATLTLKALFITLKSRCLQVRFFVVAHFNNISSIFSDCLRRFKTHLLPPLLLRHNHCPLNTALSTVRAVQDDTHLQFYREMDASNCVWNYLIFILHFKYRHFAKCWKHKDIVRFKQVPLSVIVLSVSDSHEHTDCTVYGDRGAVMTVTVTQHCYCKSKCSTWFISYWKLDNDWEEKLAIWRWVCWAEEKYFVLGVVLFGKCVMCTAHEYWRL